MFIIPLKLKGRTGALQIIQDKRTTIPVKVNKQGRETSHEERKARREWMKKCWVEKKKS